MPRRLVRTHSFVIALSLALGGFADGASAQSPVARRGIALDERLAADAGIHLGDLVTLSSAPGASARDTFVVSALTRRTADPSEVARAEYQVRLHLTDLQRLAGYDNRVDRFAVATRDDSATGRALARINDAAFGFRAWRSRDIAVGTSRTFQVVQRFDDAIGAITIVASAIFLLCILLLRVDERRRDVAALRLMGISRRTVVRSIMLEAAIVALLGSALGTVAGWITSRLINWHYQGVYRTPLTFSLVTPGIVAFAVTLSVVLGVGAGWLAARRLAGAEPMALLGR